MKPKRRSTIKPPPAVASAERASAELGERLVAEEIAAIKTRLREQRNSEAERAMLFARWRDLAHPKPHATARRTHAPTFVAEASIETKVGGRTIYPGRTIYRDLLRADELDALLQKIAGTDLDRGKYLDALRARPKIERERIVCLVLKGGDVEELMS